MCDETGYEPGKGDAYDYIPAWMSIPKLYTTEDQDDPLAMVKLFTPDTNWTWYVIEADSEGTAFGLVVGFETELGYFSISELQSIEGPMGLRIERDLWFEPTSITDVPEYRAKWGKLGGPYKGVTSNEPAFQAGDQVWWYEGPGSAVKTGTVQYTPRPDDDRIAVNCDERSAINGGVIIDHIKHISADKLNQGDGPTPEARAMRDLFYDDEGSRLPVDEMDQDRAAELLAPFLPGGSNGPDKVFEPLPGTQLSLF